MIICVDIPEEVQEIAEIRMKTEHTGQMRIRQPAFRKLTDVLEDIKGEIESNMPDATYDEGDCGYLSGLATAADVVERHIDWERIEDEEGSRD